MFPARRCTVCIFPSARFVTINIRIRARLDTRNEPNPSKVVNKRLLLLCCCKFLPHLFLVCKADELTDELKLPIPRVAEEANKVVGTPASCSFVEMPHQSRTRNWFLCFYIVERRNLCLLIVAVVHAASIRVGFGLVLNKR